MAFLSPALASFLCWLYPLLQGGSCSPVHTAPPISKLGNYSSLQASCLQARALTDTSHHLCPFPKDPTATISGNYIIDT